MSESVAPAMAATTESPPASAPEQNTAPEKENAEVVKAESKEQTATTKQKIQAFKEKFKYVIDGQEVEEEIDLSNKEALRKRFQLGYAADKRMTEAKTAKQQAMEIVKAFEADPVNMLKRLGPKGRETAEKYLLEQIKQDMMTPEEKEAMAMKSELEKYKEQEAKTKEQKESEARAQIQNRYVGEYQQTIIQALEKTGLPKSPGLVKEAARLMAKNLELGLDLDTTDLAALIKEETGGMTKAMIKDMDGDQIIEFLGPDVAKKIRQSDIRKLKEKQSQLFTGGARKSEPSVSKRQERPMTMDEWKAAVEERVK